MELIMKGKYIYKGQWTEVEKLMAETFYTKVRAMYIDVVNPLIESFNKEWNDTHPEADLDDEHQMDLYNRFMADKSNESTEYTTFLMKAYDVPFYGGFSQLDCNFILINDNGGTCELVLYPMEEKYA